MKNSIRWGLTGLTAMGLLVAGAAFVGCSSSSEGTTPTDDTGVADTATTDSTADSTADSTPADSATDSKTDSVADAADGETAVVAQPRKMTIVHAAPDAGKQLFCFGAGAAGSLAKALFLGVPDASAPTDETKYTGFNYGTVLPLTFPNALVSSDLIAGLEKLTIYVWPIGSTNPTSATVDGPTACTNSWATVKGDATKFIEVPKNTVLGGTSTVLYATGCLAPGSKLECGGATPQALKLGYKVLNLTSPFPGGGGDAGTDGGETGETGTTGKNVAVHFLHASAFPGVTGAAISFQGVDVYLLPMTAGVDGGTGTPAGTPTKIATNVKYGDWVDPSVAFTLPAGADENSTLLVFQKTGDAFCVKSAAAPTCASIPVPASYFLPAYKAGAAAGGAPTPGFVDGTDQLFLIAGSPTDTNPTTTTLRWGFGNVTKP
jgi:hypothetical protein